jgi:hypothetical protein|tara:strand:+ start:190 stop:375 length:186 start_codon:yes stop_codon:yes gene_type:complete
MANFEGLDDALLSNRCGSIKALLTYKLENEKQWSKELIDIIKDINTLTSHIIIDQEEGKKQ